MPSFCPLSRNLLTPLLLRWDDLRKLYVLIETSSNTLCPVILITAVHHGGGGVFLGYGCIRDAGQNRPIGPNPAF